MLLTSIAPWSAVAAVAAAMTLGVVARPDAPGAGQPGPAPAPARPAEPPPRPPATTPPDPLPPDRRDAFRRALAAAEEQADASDRAEELLRVGRALTRQGNRAGAREVLAKALAVIAAAPAGENWTVPHPMLRIGEAQALNGDHDDARRTFAEAGPVLLALPGLRPGDDFNNGLRIAQQAVGRAGCRPLAAAYRKYLGEEPARWEALVGRKRSRPAAPANDAAWVLRTLSAASWRFFGGPGTGTTRTINQQRWVKSLAYEGDFAAALDRARNPEMGNGLTRSYLRQDGLVEIAEVLLPSDPPALADPILAEARRGLLERPGDAVQSSNLYDLMGVLTKLGRFAEADELGEEIARLKPAEVGEGPPTVHLFNWALQYANLARAEADAGQADRARVAARKALVPIGRLEKLSEKAHPLSIALTAMVVAAGEAEAFRIFEESPADFGSIGDVATIFGVLTGRGEAEAAGRWRDLALERTRRNLDRARAGEADGLPKVEHLVQAVRKLEWLGRPIEDRLRQIVAMPASERGSGLRELASELAKAGRVPEASALAERAASPEERRAVEMLIFSSLPAPADAPQSPRSDAAR